MWCVVRQGGIAAAKAARVVSAKSIEAMHGLPFVPLSALTRATAPLIRDQRTRRLEPIEWEYALFLFSERLKELRRLHGPDSVALLAPGRLVTEEFALLAALFRIGMGFAEFDLSSAKISGLLAFQRSFGIAASTGNLPDIEDSDVIVILGSNLCIDHPGLWQRVLRNRWNPDVIVIDSRATEMSIAASHRVQIQPGSEATLLRGLANIMIASHWISRDFIDSQTTGFEPFAESILRFTPDVVAAETGVAVDDLWHLAQMIADGKRTSFWLEADASPGSDPEVAQALIHLALLTGSVGRNGADLNALSTSGATARVLADLPRLLGGEDFADPCIEPAVRQLFGLAAETPIAAPTLTPETLPEAIRAGRIKALWVVATDAPGSWLDLPGLQPVLSQLDLIVVQDTRVGVETSQHADLVFPSASLGEKEGTIVDSERRITHARRLGRAPGQALSDFNIFKLIALYWGCGDLFRAWSSPEEVFQILRRLSSGRPVDFGGIVDFRMLDRCGGIQFPCSEGAGETPADERRLIPGRRSFVP